MQFVRKTFFLLIIILILLIFGYLQLGFPQKPFLSVCVKNEHELADCCACLKGEGHWMAVFGKVFIS